MAEFGEGLGAQDSRFVAFLHRNPVLDVVDDDWRRETLADDGARPRCRAVLVLVNSKSPRAPAHAETPRTAHRY